LRKTIKRLQGCLGSLRGLERRVLVLRAGVGAGPPRTRSRVARRLDLSTRRVTRLERRGVRRLRSLAGAGRCGGAASPGGAALAAEGALIATALHGLKALFGDGPWADRTVVKAWRQSFGGQGPDEAATDIKKQWLAAPPGVSILVTLLLIASCLSLLGLAVRRGAPAHRPAFLITRRGRRRGAAGRRVDQPRRALVTTRSSSEVAADGSEPPGSVR
jgi:hypothetical protein